MDKYLKIDYVWDLEDMIDEENIIEQLDWKDFYFNILDIVLDAPILFGDIYSDNVQKWLPIINDIAKKLGLKKIYHLDSRELYPFGVVDVREQEKKDLMESPYTESYYSISKFMMEIDYYKDASLIIYDNEYKLYEEFDESLLEQILKIYV